MAADMKGWLSTAGVEKYIEKSLDEEYDDVSRIGFMKEAEVAIWAADGTTKH
jgi:hypothetical protein